MWSDSMEELNPYEDISNQERLAELLKDFDIPEFRREINQWNVGWMIRNIAIRNRDNPNFKEVWRLIITVYKEFLK